MIAYIARRLAVAVPTLLILVIFSYILMYSAPGGPFNSERPFPPEVIKNLEEKYGLNQPLWRQIVTYVWSVVTQFDFGPSFQYKDRTVNDIITQGFPITLTYGGISFVVAATVGISLGVLGALRQNTFVDAIAVTFSMVAQVLPNFVMAPILIIMFTLWPTLDGGDPWLPGGGWNNGALPNLVMPVIALSTSYMASITRITRASMIEVLNSNFIRTAKAKGLPERQIIWRHSLKPAMLPVLSYLGPAFVGMITGSVLIDIFFSTGGIGQFFVNSAFSRDYAVIMGITILVGALTIFFNLVVDLLYAWLDPKIRY